MNWTPTRSASAVIPYICLFFSGAASLVYELVWIRQLTLIFGGTLYAISAVLCAFMGGLALGAWALPHYLNWRNRHHRPPRLVRLYGVLEGLIGLYALGFPLGLELLQRLYPLAMAGSLESGPLLHFLEFFFSAALMIPPTMLMGATLPLLGSWVIGDRAGKVYSHMALLYSLNTFGAVAGCLYTQWFAIEQLGVRGTVGTAVAVNALVFLLCIRFPDDQAAKTAADLPALRPVHPKTRNHAEPVPGPGLSLLLLFVFFYSGMASLSSEILWTRVLVFPMGSTLYSFALILATFLFGIALGSLVSEKLLGNSRWVWKFLLLELAIGVLGLAILPLFDHVPEWTAHADRMIYDVENTPARTLFIRSLFAFGLMFPPALGFGLIFPLANRVHLNLFGTVGRTLGNSYAVNTVGAVVGTVLTPFVFIPLWGIQLSAFLIFAGLIVLSIVGLAWHLHLRSRRLGVAAALAAVLVFGGYAFSTPRVDTERLGDHNLARLEIDVPRDRLRLLDYKEGDFATLSVVEDQKTGQRTLYVNGFSTATVSPGRSGSAYMQAMGFVPMALHPDPQTALVIGFGTGNTLGTVSLFPGVQADGVEIDRNILDFAKWFAKWNFNVLERPNVRLILGDGRTWVRWTDRRYDVITLEPMSPVHAGVVNLYSREFYRQAFDRLNDDGLMMQWLPLHLVGQKDAQAIVQTMREVFPHLTVWNSFLTRIVLLVGSKEPVRLDEDRFDRLMEHSELAEATRQMMVNSFLDFADFYLTDGGKLDSFLEGAPVITDDRPLLEFSQVTLLPPLAWQTDETFLNLLRYRVGADPPVTGISGPPKAAFKRAYEIRTAQRLSVFVRRYHGPGERLFADRAYLPGLEAMKIYLNQKGDAPIRLSGAQWQD